MNYSVIVNSDTSMGHIIAQELAAEKRNLILIGKSESELNQLMAQIRKKHKVYIYPLLVDDYGPQERMRVSEYINENFFVESLIQISLLKKETNETIKPHELLEDFEEENILALRMLDQLFPNLMLQAFANFVHIICSPNEMPVYCVTICFSEARVGKGNIKNDQ